MVWKRWDRLRRDESGVSHVLGVILVVSVVMIGVISIVGFGVVGLVGTTSDISDTAVERDLTAFADAVDTATIYSDTATGTTGVTLSTSEVADNREWLTVDETAGEIELLVRTSEGETMLVEESLGIVEYNSPRSTARIAYQSGVVFSSVDEQTTPAVVRSNAFAHRATENAESLTLHLIRITGSDQLDREVEIEPVGVQNSYPEMVLDGESELVLRIESRYAESWVLAMREVFPAGAQITQNEQSLEVSYQSPADGMFLHVYTHEVELDGR